MRTASHTGLRDTGQPHGLPQEAHDYIKTREPSVGCSLGSCPRDPNMGSKESPGAPAACREHLPPASHSFQIHPQTMSSDHQPGLSLSLPEHIASFTHIRGLVFQGDS